MQEHKKYREFSDIDKNVIIDCVRDLFPKYPRYEKWEIEEALYYNNPMIVFDSEKNEVSISSHDNAVIAGSLGY